MFLCFVCTPQPKGTVLFDADTTVCTGAEFKESVQPNDKLGQKALLEVGDERLACLFVLNAPTSSQRVFLRASDEEDMAAWVTAISARLGPLDLENNSLDLENNDTRKVPI